MKKKSIQTIEVDTSNGHIKVSATIIDPEDVPTRAELPQRELSTLLPRTLLLGDALVVTPEIFDVIEETLSKLLIGRRVKIWEYDGKTYFGFLTWRSVKLAASLEEVGAPGMG